jgi:mono/diheme cytochrome c family protein
MSKRSLQVLIGVLILSLLTVGAALAQSDGDPDNGATLYAEYCAACHGENGEGRTGRELNAAFAAIDVDEFLRQSITEGRPGTFMPTWGEDLGGPLSEQDVDDIITYIETWGTASEPVLPPPRPPDEDIPPVTEVDGDPNEGALIFAENCVACHGEQGEGSIGETLAKEFPSAEPGAYVISAVTNGIGDSEDSGMPAWGEENGGPLSEDDIQNVAAYVLSLEPVGTGPPPPPPPPQFSALPLIIIAVGGLVILIGLGWLSQRRSGQS